MFPFGSKTERAAEPKRKLHQDDMPKNAKVKIGPKLEESVEVFVPRLRRALADIMELCDGKLCSYSGSGEGSRKRGAVNEEEREEEDNLETKAQGVASHRPSVPKTTKRAKMRVDPTCDSNKSCVFRTVKGPGGCIVGGRRYLKMG